MSYHLNNPSGHAGMPSESPAKEISELLKVPVQFAGEYTFGGAATTLPSIPGLDVNGYGPLTVPLVDPAQTERLIARSLEINATAADPEELCVTWQLDATQVTITNKAWETGLAQLVATVADRLGCRHVPLSANLARLLVCGPGSIISCGEDVAVKSRKFATLFIQLPSAHEGGDLVVSEPDGTAVTFDFGAADGTSPFSPQYALFYDNAEHAFKPITSGYRIALVYSICWPEGHKQIDLLESLPTLRQLGNHLSTLGKEHRSFFFTLSQKHEPTTLGRQRIKALMGQDFARSNMIRAANAMLGESSAFTLYLVQSVRDVHNGPDLMRFRQSYPLWIDMETGKQYSSAQENINIGAMINPDGKSDEDLWSVEKKRLSVRGWQTHYCYSCDLLVGVPKSLGPCALLPYIGNGAIDQIIDISSCTAAEFSRLLASLPTSSKQPVPLHKDLLHGSSECDFYSHPHLLPTTKDDFSAKLLGTLVSRSLVPCIAPFFATMPDPLSAAMIPAYLQAMATPDLWAEIQPHLVAHMHKAQEPFMLGVKLACDAILVANMPIDSLVDLIHALGSLPAPSHMLTSMGAVLTRAAKIPRVWTAVHATVVSWLLAAVAENKMYGESGYNSVSARQLVFQLTLAIAVRAATVGVPAGFVGELADVLVRCELGAQTQGPIGAAAPAHPLASTYAALEALGPLFMSGAGMDDRLLPGGGAHARVKLGSVVAKCMPDFKLAAHLPGVWTVIMPMLCDWLARPDVSMNRFAYAVELVDELVNRHDSSAVLVDAAHLWQPILDASMAPANFLSPVSPSTVDNRHMLANLIVRCMRREKVWTHVSARITQALCLLRNRFEIGIRVLEMTHKDASMPVNRWVPLVPVVFAEVPSKADIDRYAGHDQLAFWSVVLAGDDGEMMDKLVGVHVGAKYPAGLQPTVAAIVTLLASGHLPMVHARRFVPVLESRLSYLGTVVPPADQPRPTPWVIASASLPNDPMVERFLRSNEEKLAIVGFSRRREAKEWARGLGDLYFEEREVYASVEERPGREWRVELRKAAPKGYRWMETDEKKLAEMRGEVRRIEQALERVREEGSVRDDTFKEE